ncbi:hypothetical protein [Scytonema sp. NUACC21]
MSWFKQIGELNLLLNGFGAFSAFTRSHRISHFSDLFLRRLIEGSFAFTHPIFPLPGCTLWLGASLGFIPRFTHYRYQQCMGELGTVTNQVDMLSAHR